MQYEGFIGGSYTSQSPNADSQKTLNWYLERIESGEGKFRQALYPTPGLRVFSVPTAAQQVGISSVSVSRAGDTSAAISTAQVISYDQVSAGIQTAATGTGGTGSVDYYCSPSTLSKSVSNHTVGTTTGSVTTPAGGFGGTAVTAGQTCTLSMTLNFSTIPDPPNGGYCQLDYSLNNGSTWININTYIVEQLINVSVVLSPIITNLFGLMVRLTVASTYASGLNAICAASVSNIRATISGGGTWTNSFTGSPSVLSDSTITMGTGVLSNQLLCSNIAFGLPTGRTVNGVSVGITINANVTTPSANVWTIKVGLVYQGAPIGTVKTYQQAASATSLVQTFGGATDTWGATLTDAMVSDPTFGCYVQVQATSSSNVAFDLQNITPTVYSSGDYYAKLQLPGGVPFSVGDSVIGYGLTGATWLNGVPLTIQSISGNFVTCVNDLHAAAYPQTAETGSLYNTVPSYALCTTSAVNPFSVGAQITFASLAASANLWLNGVTAIISATPTTTSFKVPVTHADYTTVTDTGIVFIGGTSGTPSTREIYAVNGTRLFAVVIGNLYEVFADGSFINRGNVASDGTVVSMASSVNQLLIASAGVMYCYNLTANTITNVANYTGGSAIPPVSKVEYCDGYFLALLSNSQQWIISAIGDGTTWDPLDIDTVSVFPDNIVSFVVDHREVVLLGSRHSVIYANTGNPDFPFEVIGGSFIDQGCAAKESVVRLDNSVFWIGQDDRGGCMAWRLNAQVPQRISTHAVEYAWSQYATCSDAAAYGYQDQGHSFWVIYFPTANKTWVYDAATGLWHERGFWNGSSFDAHRSQNHAYCFGKHLVGDWSTGVIYEMNIAYTDDFGNAIVRQRRSPIINNEMEWLYIDAFRLDLEVGLGLQTGQGSNPLVMCRYSDDQTKTWSDLINCSAGQVGKYRTRVMWRRQGRTRNRVYEVSVSDPVPWRIVAAYLDFRQ